MKYGGQIASAPTINFPQGIWIGTDCADSGNSSLLKNSIDNSKFVLPNQNYQNRNIYIKGSVTLNSNYTFDMCDFCMNPNSRIVAKTHMLSFIDGTTLHESPYKVKAWYGLELNSGIVKGDGSVFSGAYNAIYSTTTSSSSATLQLSTCRFERNYLGIRLDKGILFGIFSNNTFGTDGAVISWPGLVTNTCNYAWVNKISKPVKPTPFAGIYAQTPVSQPAVTLYLVPNSSSLVNRFTHLANGIYLDDANGYIQKCSFENITVGEYSPSGINGILKDGFGVAIFATNYRSLSQTGIGKNATPLTFNHCTEGIHAENIIPATSSSGGINLQCINNNMIVNRGIEIISNGRKITGGLIKNNQINFDNYFGVYFSDANTQSHLEISNNRIVGTACPFCRGIWLVNNFPATQMQNAGSNIFSVINNATTSTDNDGVFNCHEGILLTNFHNALIQNNTVHDSYLTGIIFSSNSSYNTGRCNEITNNTDTGWPQGCFGDFLSPNNDINYNSVNGGYSGIIVESVNTNSIFSCNNIGSHEIGLYYDLQAVTGDELPNQTSGGNTWNGSYSQWAALNYHFLSFGTGGRYFFRSGELNASQVNPPTWVVPVSTGTTCATSCPTVSHHDPRAVTYLDNQVANGTLNDSGLSGYLEKKFLLTDLFYFPDLLTGNSNLQNFLSSNSTSVVGRLVSIEKSMADGFNLTSQQQAQWDQAQSDLESVSSQLVTLNDLAINGSDIDSQTSQRDALAQQALTSDNTMVSILQSNLNSRIGLASSIQQNLNNVIAQAQYEVNDKTLDQIFLNTVFVNQAPSDAQIEQIRLIAIQCSVDGGPATTIAKSWYNNLTGIQIEVNCNGTIERSEMTEISNRKELKISISPNPANNSVNLHLSKELLEATEIDIFSVTGELITTISIPAKTTSVEINTGGFSNGVYFSRLKNGDHLIQTEKFYIQH
jgi:parallel beta-helix repeat protein